METNNPFLLEERKLKDEIRALIQSEDYDNARKKLASYLRRVYGDKAVDTWSFRYYLHISEESSPIELDQLVADYLAGSSQIYYRQEKRTSEPPLVFTLDNMGIITNLYNKIRQQKPDIDKSGFLRLIASKFISEDGVVVV